jgi:hypothetical protein
MRSTLFALGAIGLVLAVAFGVRATEAPAAVPCWRAVIADWSQDGSIDGIYPAACYRQAMQNAPTDLRIYSSIEDDLQSALRQRSARRLAAAHPSAATVLASGGSSSLPFLVGLVAGLGVLLAGCSVVAALVRRRSIG